MTIIKNTTSIPYESEYNDERAFATPFNEKIEGYLSNPADVDWYSIKISTYDEKTIVTFDTSSMNFGIWNVYWYYPDMTVLSGKNIGAGGIPPNMENAKLTYDLYTFQPGTYYLRVHALNDTFYNGGSYDISVIKPLAKPTGSVTITGAATQNQTLTASNTLADNDGLGTITYSWYRDDVAITNATQSTYTLTQTDVGKKISVKAGYTDNAGTSESVISIATSSVTNVNDTPKGNVTISGTANQNQILTANNTLTDLDGLGTITYQWLSNNKEISNASQSTYKLAQSDVGNVISVKASYTDGFGSKETVTSAATAKIENVNDAPTGNVSISGLAAQGQTLTIVNTLADLDGLGTIKYQWLSNGAALSGATKTSYVLSSSDIGKTISIKASYTDLLGTSESVTSQSSDAVISTKPSKGNDVLTGTAKNDTLSALAGNDILTGGLGADKLTGGLGADIFKYVSTGDSGITTKTRDTITDFKHSEGDKIDLSAIVLPSDQSFTYIGTIAFSNDATAQLRLDPKTGLLYGSTNADNIPEFSILLSGVKSLVPEDFIL
jgi:Ca2+-binding RTX toxin-like protein